MESNTYPQCDQHAVVPPEQEPPKRIGKFRASWLLTKQSFALLWADKEMLFFPLLACFASLIFTGLLITFLIFNLDLIERLSEEQVMIADYVVLFISYVASAFFVTFSGVGVASIVHGRVSGRDLTFGDGFSAAAAKVGTIFMWSLISATVGIILKLIERQKVLGRILAAVLGVAWALMTYFVIPIIALERVSAWQGTKLSASTFRRMWGEVLVTNFGIGLFFTLVFVLEIIAFFGLMVAVFSAPDPSFLAVIGLAVAFFLTLFVTALISTTIDAILKVALYLYARDGVVPQAFSPELIIGMVKAKKPPASMSTAPTSHSSVLS